MKHSFIKILWMAPGVGFLTISSLVQVSERTAPRTSGQAEAKVVSMAPDVPSCNLSLGEAAAHVSDNPHSVTLSWNASVAKSTSKLDVIQGYYIYRSRTSQTYTENDRINSSPLPGTTCVDTDVEPGETYFYSVKAVTVGGGKSDFSKEAKAKVPFP